MQKSLLIKTVPFWRPFRVRVPADPQLEYSHTSIRQRGDLTRTQMYFRRGAEDWLDKRQSHSRQSVETAPEFMADQTANGNVLD